MEGLNKTYTKQVDKLPAQAVLDDIDKNVDQTKLEQTLMAEGTAKFAEPFHALLKQIAAARAKLAPAK